MRPFTGPTLLFAFALVASGCEPPCERLTAWASSCGAAVSAHVHAPESVCRQSRREVGAKAFDAFAECITESSCDDGHAIERCRNRHVLDRPEDACLGFRLWASACGLEPPGTQDDCGGLSTSLGAPTFDTWAGCMTEGGCATFDDDRYARCRDLLLAPQATQLLDACLLVEEWTTRCAQEPTTLPVEPTPIPVCLAQAEPFAPGTYLEYATCLSTLGCNAVSERVDCLFLLRITERDQIAAQCEQLLAFTTTCGSLVAGGTEDACISLFARYTPASIDIYSDCLRSGDCADLENAAQCAQLLVFQ